MVPPLLTEQQCKYKSAECQYPGDSVFRSLAQLNEHRREKTLRQLRETIGGGEVVTYDVWCEAKVPRGWNAKTRLCSNAIEKLREHLRSFKPVSVCTCQVCNNECYWKYMVCPDKPAGCLRQDVKGQCFTCAFHFHNDYHFGFACLIIGTAFMKRRGCTRRLQSSW